MRVPFIFHNYPILLASFLLLSAVNTYGTQTRKNDHRPVLSNTHKVNIDTLHPFLVILGTAQDAGSPQAGCTKECCFSLFAQPDPGRMVVSLGLVLPESHQRFLIEATPDLPAQLRRLREAAPFASSDVPDGIFLTHAHIGHYSGLMYLGKEAMDTKGVPVHCLPGMASFLKNHAPWEQLVTRQNIHIQTLTSGQMTSIAANVTVTPILVPHRDEYSETAGFIIRGPERSALFIPDIDKWEKWEQDILSLIREVDYAFLDGTFYDGTELPGRDIREIPHPFVAESMQLFEALPREERAKVHFIHFNHTNPLLNNGSEEYHSVVKQGFGVASTGQIFRL